jgi:3-dehydroquinate dehydratase-1
MKPRLIISVSSEQDYINAKKYAPDLIEIRIDLLGEGEDKILEECSGHCNIPLVGTIRSLAEGGLFDGSADEWYEEIKPWIPVCDYIDLEMPYSGFSRGIRDCGKKVIPSVHLDYMPDDEELISIERSLRNSGDIPKIIVTPEDHGDVIRLSEFTLNCAKPVITGVMGAEFRWARALCCLFGSYAVFCHAGNPASQGQYHIDEMRQILSLLDVSDNTGIPG